MSARMVGLMCPSWIQQCRYILTDFPVSYNENMIQLYFLFVLILILVL